MANSHPDSQPRPRTRVLIGAVAVLAALVTTGIVSSAIAERATQLGKSRTSPRPACPTPQSPAEDEICRVSGQVTGFQRKIDGKGGPFKVRADGRIVAWSVDLSKPNENERGVFGEAAQTNEFGEKATAGISILQPKGGGEFKLIRQSPVLPMQAYFGEQPVFTLDKPLRVRKGQIVAVTTVTWLPFLGIKNVSNNNTWLASRTRAQCEIPSNVPEDEQIDWFFDHTKAQRKVGSQRKYKCVYESTRLLYWAYLAPRNN